MPPQGRPIARSWLYVPGHKARMVEKSFDLPADAVIYDLEDAVPPAQKQTARDTLVELLAGREPGTAKRYVRLNHPRNAELFEADLTCTVSLGVDGVAIPKVEAPDEVRAVAAALDGAESAAGAAVGSTRIMLLIESPLGLVNAYAIASSSARIAAVCLGGEDLAREMGLPLIKTAEAKEMLYQRSTVAVAAAAAGVQPVDVIWTDLDDVDGLAAEAAQARRLGFSGKAAIHPDQLAPINRAFSPTPGEVAYAQEVIAAFDAAVAKGTGAVNYKGAFLEEPVIARARTTLELAQRLEETR